MPDWVLWAIVAAILTAGEVATTAFLAGPIALAAVLTALVALAGGGIEVQLATFIVGSVASLGLIRPIAKRHLRTPLAIRTGTAALIGQRVVVLERVNADGGQVKIGGEVWSARCYDEDEVLEPGDRAEVMKIEGAVALVSQV
jgi:membrane protein implicated in regulation of membrane protease activity